MTLNIEKHIAWGLSRKQTGGAQLTLRKGEVHRLNPLPPGIVVIAGCAWVSWSGQDILLNKGEGTRFSQGGDDPVISAVGGAAVTIEMLP